MARLMNVKGCAEVHDTGVAHVTLRLSSVLSEGRVDADDRQVAPTGKDIVTLIAGKRVDVHPSKSDWTASAMGAQIATIQRTFLLPTGRHGGWCRAAQQELEDWLGRPVVKRSRRECANALTDVARDDKAGDRDDQHGEETSESDDSDTNSDSDSDTDDKGDADDKKDQHLAEQLAKAQADLQKLLADNAALTQENAELKEENESFREELCFLQRQLTKQKANT